MGVGQAEKVGIMGHPLLRRGLELEKERNEIRVSLEPGLNENTLD